MWKNGVVATFLHGMDGRQSTRDSLYTEKMGFSFWKSHIGKWVKGKGNEMKDSPVLFYYKPIYLYKSFKSWNPFFEHRNCHYCRSPFVKKIRWWLMMITRCWRCRLHKCPRKFLAKWEGEAWFFSERSAGRKADAQNLTNTLLCTCHITGQSISQ